MRKKSEFERYYYFPDKSFKVRMQDMPICISGRASMHPGLEQLLWGFCMPSKLGFLTIQLSDILIVPIAAIKNDEQTS